MSRFNIAVGLIYSADKQKLLIGKRPEGLEQAGFWEFPGGKIEAGEEVAEALQRELFEEVNIHVSSSTPFLEYNYDYEHRKVSLFVRKVEHWQGDVIANEGQILKWIKPQELALYNMLKANQRIIDNIHKS